MCYVAIPLILAAAAAAVTAASQYQQSQAQAKQYKREAKIAREQATFDAQRQQRDIRRRMGTLQVAAAGSGIMSSTGSPLDVAANFATEAQLEPFETFRQGMIRYQDAWFAAKRTKAQAGASLLADVLQIGSQVTGGLMGGAASGAKAATVPKASGLTATS